MYEILYSPIIILFPGDCIFMVIYPSEPSITKSVLPQSLIIFKDYFLSLVVIFKTDLS